MIAALDLALPDVRHVNEHAAWKQCERLLTHALLCLQRAGATSESLPLASLAHKTAIYLLRNGRHLATSALREFSLLVSGGLRCEEIGWVTMEESHS